MTRIALVLGVATAFCVQSLSAVSPATESFTGKYRKIPKTTIARNGTKIVSTEEYKDLHSLLVTLPKDTTMRTKYPGLRRGLKKDWPAKREPEENRNVRIKSCWIISAKHERQLSKGVWKGDNDFHVILSQTPNGSFKEVMNAEISGLPSTSTPDFNKLRDVRAFFLTLANNVPSSSKFSRMTPAAHVTVEGSLYFDGDHGAGGKSDPGPAWAKPQSVWEIHPIYKLIALAD